MAQHRLLLALAIGAAFLLASCSGIHNSSGGGGGGGGTGSFPVSMTMSSVPSGVPGGISILSFTVNIAGITITSATTGAVTNLSLTNFTVDLSKLLSDSAFLGQFTVASGSYSKIQVSIAGSTVVYCTSASGVAGCTSGSTAKVTGTASTLTFTYSPALDVASPGIGVRFAVNMANALVLNSTGTAVQSIDFTQTSVASSQQLPVAANLTSPQLDYVDDVTGVVTQVGTSSITIQSATAGTITANVTSLSNFSSQTCSTNGIGCAKVGQVASMDTILNADGTFTLLLFDPIDATSSDWVEGEVDLSPANATQFAMVVKNFVPAQSGSLISGSVHLGDPVTVNIAAGTVFTIDQRNLTVPSNGFNGAQDTSVIFPGQEIAVRASAFTAAVGSTSALLTANALMLRFTRLAGTANSAGPNFTFTPNAPLFGINATTSTFETQSVTNYDLPVSGTSLTTTQAAGISALYLGPPSTAIFVVTKVRQ